MSEKYKNLDELRHHKKSLEIQVAEMEDILKFKNKAKSLRKITNGYSDKFVEETMDEYGEPQMVIKKDAIIKSISTNVKNKVANKDAVVGITNKAMDVGVVDDILQLGVSTLIASIARKQLKSKSWGKKAIGYALIYVAPFVLKKAAQKATEKATEIRKKQSISSMEKII